MFVQLGLRLRTHKLVATFTTYLNPILMGNPKKLLDLTRIGSLLKWGLDKVRKNNYRKVIKSHKSRWIVSMKSRKLLLSRTIIN